MNNDEGTVHRPVLLKEVLSLLELNPGMVVVDATVGAGGHAAAILERICPGGFLLGIDRDPQAAELAERALLRAGYTRGRHFDIEVRRFSQVDEALAPRRISGADRLLADLGVCSMHFDWPERGFSLKREGPLDMRLDSTDASAPTAADIVNSASEEELTRIFRQYGEERWAPRIARAIVEHRTRDPITTTTQLREIVAQAIPRRHWPPTCDPATRVFQALRIAVNSELEELDALLAKLPKFIKPRGRAAVISFHSLEDRRVKETFRELARKCTCPADWPMCRCGGEAKWRIVTKKPVVADETEIRDNPRSRSAKLRVIERLK
ncbi:MAG: 16S rRNA (cytosine(1402)-N(4))-methyltransferase RsmH [Candidatus Sumerlaeaceae bacterium]|nr:16S rRNA (cytosine(1402)-N(4))-methyltransferase RsmH [Candidatus Sumerlaeaceae bacterium]